MAHPFEKTFMKALDRSHGDENVVLGEAERLIEEGYPPKEILDILRKLKAGLIAAGEEAIVEEALEELGPYDVE